jgi:ketosteroid isomerase-like protein
MSSNLDLVQGVYESFAAGDIPAVLAVLSPAVE